MSDTDNPPVKMRKIRILIAPFAQGGLWALPRQCNYPINCKLNADSL